MADSSFNTPLAPSGRGKVAAGDSPWRGEGRPWWREWELVALVILALGIFGTRLTDVSIRGEESRWARAAYEMVSTGDWAVPRQQAQLHPDRPPLAIWTIALSALTWGDFDQVSIRLPSVLATLLAAVAIYAYGRTFLSQLGALAAAVAYLTMGQVLQIGRLAENDPLFTLLVTAALLAWHAGYQAGWRPALTWVAAYALAALATLTKGPQGAAYFCGPVWIFLLLVRRDWRYFASAWQALGLATFAALYVAWLLPFYWATNWQSVVEISWTTSAMRFAGHSPLWKHLLTYPIEILACTLPWSPLLFQYVRPQFWRSLGAARPQVVFLITCLAVTFPSVWFATEAHPRYFMSMFPCLALLIGLVVERCAASEAVSALRRAWRFYLAMLAIVALTVGLVIAGAGRFSGLAELQMPAAFNLVYLTVAAVACGLLLRGGWSPRVEAARPAVVALGVLVGLSYTGVAISSQARSSQDFAAAVEKFKHEFPAGEHLVSLNRLDHLFTFYYRDAIELEPWPTAKAGPADGEYFCFTPTPDMPEELPFTWKQVAVLTCSRSGKLDPLRLVVVGRRLDAPLGQTADVGTKTRRY